MSVAAEELSAYAEQLRHGVDDLLGTGLIDEVARALDAKASALAALGGTFGRDPERTSEMSGRVQEDIARLRSDYEALVASPTDEWTTGNVLVGLGNVYISTASSVARSSCGRDFVWALPQLAEMGAARLLQREYTRMRDALEAEWLVLQSAEAASGAIEALYAIPIPAGLNRHDLHASELPAMRHELEQAFALLDTPITPGAHDDSDRAAEWLQLPADNVEQGNESSQTTDWRPTHRVGASGVAAWESQQGGQPVARLDPGLDVLVEQTDGDWARVSCDNGWSGWVDRHQLEPRS
jgi:hypothetical protein